MARPKLLRKFAFWSLAGGLLGLACAAPVQRGFVPANCQLLDGAPLPGEEFSCFLADSLSAEHLPFPRNESETLVFAQFYETLLTIDCHGELRPGLAESWKKELGGRVWHLRLREDVRFWDGRSVEAADVMAAWIWTQTRARVRGLRLPCPEILPIAEHVRIESERELRVEFDSPCPDFLRRLATSAFAVSAAGRDLHWRLGTGPMMPSDLRAAPRSRLLCIPNPHHPSSASWRRFIFHLPPDASGLGMGDSDLVFMQDKRRLSYFRRHPDFTSHALSPGRLYLLVLPGQDAEAPLSLGSGNWLRSLHEDAGSGALFQTEAIPADCESMKRILPALPCAAQKAGAGIWPDPASLASELFVAADDPPALDLASRLLALLSAEEENARRLHVSVLTEAEFDTRLEEDLREKKPSAFILGLRRMDAWPRRLEAATLVPLVISGSFIVARDNLSGVTLSGNGLPLLAGIGFKTESLP